MEEKVVEEGTLGRPITREQLRAKSELYPVVRDNVHPELIELNGLRFVLMPYWYVDQEND